MSAKSQPKVTEEELKRQYEADFDPEIYLNQLYRKPDGPNEHYLDYMKFAVTNFHRIFAIDLPEGGESVLNLGCGPTIHEVISASGRYKTIVSAEFLEQNRNAVKKWLRKDPDAFDWTYVFQLVAKLEKEPDHTKLEARVRDRYKEVLKLDLTLENPLAPLKRTFDVIVTGACYEAIATDDEAYKRIVARTAKLLTPNGRLIVFGLFNATFYKPCKEGIFYSYPTRKEVVEQAMANAGLEIELWIISPTHKDDTFDSDIGEFFIVLAKRKRH